MLEFLWHTPLVACAMQVVRREAAGGIQTRE